MERVILVDENDKQIGTEEKIKAHREGRLHRAFSIFTFNQEGKLLLQQRALSKYHCPGLWANTCCSHPRDGEVTEAAAHRRLMEEMGFDCPLKEAFSFIYKVKFDNGLWEHEFDHVLIGRYDGSVKANPEEVESWKWVGLDELREGIKQDAEKYAYWFRISFERAFQAWEMFI